MFTLRENPFLFIVKDSATPSPTHVIQVPKDSLLYAMEVYRLAVPTSPRHIDGTSSHRDTEAALAQLLRSLEEEQVEVYQESVNSSRFPFILTYCLGKNGLFRSHKYYFLPPISLHLEHPIVVAAKLSSLLTFLQITLPPHPSAFREDGEPGEKQVEASLSGVDAIQARILSFLFGMNHLS